MSESARKPKPVTFYIDFKSPYAYLGLAHLYRLEDDFDVDVTWLPYLLDIAMYRGSAEVDDDGRVVSAERSDYQWKRVRYTYMDVRRYANLQGLTIRGPRKIWDSSLPALGLLWLDGEPQDVRRRYMNLTFERFFKRELDIEDPAVVHDVLAEADADTDGFDAWREGDGRAKLDRVQREANDGGYFGVPGIVVDGEYFWGREHLPLIRRMLADWRRPDAPVDDPTLLVSTLG